MPGYESINTGTAHLGIILVPEHLRIANPSDVLDDLGKGTALEAYTNFFNAKFPAALDKYSNFNKISILTMPRRSECIDTVLHLNKYESLHSYIPAKAGFGGDSIQYVLIIDNLSIFRKVIQGQAMVGSGSDNLIHSGTFVMYDNINGRVVSFGTLYETSAVIFTMTQETWNTMLLHLANALSAKQPYRYEQPK
jgi:hypothetical protein